MIEIKIKISDVDYGTAVDSYLPAVIEKLGEKEEVKSFAKILGKGGALSAAVARAALAVLPQSKKDEIAVAIIERYKEDIVKNLTEFAAEKGLSFHLEDVEISAQD